VERLSMRSCPYGINKMERAFLNVHQKDNGINEESRGNLKAERPA
jgi:hypothetical protein